MKIDVEKLINQIRKHPEIYNPDHKDFSNKEIRDNIFNTLISKEMSGTEGEILNRKWNQILNKYASFIRKLSNDDSSEKVLEKFMEWPWTRHMRIFKPYVRKQFQIPTFQPAIQIPEMDPDELPPYIPFLVPSISLSSNTASRVEYQGFFPIAFDFPASGPATSTVRVRLPAYAEKADDELHGIATMLGLEQPSDEDDDDTDSDESAETVDDSEGVSGGRGGGVGGGEGVDAGGVDDDGETEWRPAAKKRRAEETPDGSVAGEGRAAEENGAGLLPDLPDNLHAETEDFTAQEQTFLAWAKTMSTFTAKRQAMVKIKINSIMSEAEFEDLDDEFFAANSPPPRPI